MKSLNHHNHSITHSITYSLITQSLTQSLSQALKAVTVQSVAVCMLPQAVTVQSEALAGQSKSVADILEARLCNLWLFLCHKHCPSLWLHANCGLLCSHKLWLCSLGLWLHNLWLCNLKLWLCSPRLWLCSLRLCMAVESAC